VKQIIEITKQKTNKNIHGGIEEHCVSDVGLHVFSTVSISSGHC